MYINTKNYQLFCFNKTFIEEGLKWSTLKQTKTAYILRISSAIRRSSHTVQVHLISILAFHLVEGRLPSNQDINSTVVLNSIFSKWKGLFRQVG